MLEMLKYLLRAKDRKKNAAETIAEIRSRTTYGTFCGNRVLKRRTAKAVRLRWRGNLEKTYL